jgi:hypothetical protein
MFEGFGSGKVHRSGPEHFKLARVSNSAAIPLLVEYDKEVLAERDRQSREGTPRNPREMRLGLRKPYSYNQLHECIRFFLDDGQD